MLTNFEENFYNDTANLRNMLPTRKLNESTVYIPQGKLLGRNSRGETMPGATEALTDS